MTISHDIRAHWAIKNSYHWVMDVNYREDKCLIGATMVRRTWSRSGLAQNQIKLDASKGSQRVKRERMGWSYEYLQELFGLLSPAQLPSQNQPLDHQNLGMG